MKIGAIICFVILIVWSRADEKNYTEDVLKLKEIMEDKNGSHYHSTYERLAYISDLYGPRLWGSRVL